MGVQNQIIRSETILSEEEKGIVDQFRSAVSDILTPEDNDKYLVKWLIARNFNLEKAEQMLRKHVSFRKTIDVSPDFIPAKGTKYCFTAALGYDNEGSIVRYLPLGACDLKGLSICITKIDAIQFWTHIIEHDEYIQKKEKGDACDEKRVFISDLSGVTWRSVFNRYFVERTMLLLKMYEANYPESLKVAYILNAPSFFGFLYSWLKTILPESIISKIQVLSLDEWSTIMKNTMDPAIIPACIRGTRTDPDGDPNCRMLYEVPLGTPIPESLMPSNLMDVLPKDPVAKRTVVYKRSSFKLENVVTVVGSTLQWDFQTVNYDIGIGLRFKKDKKSGMEEIIPVHRVDSHIFPESGNFLCDRLGIYEIKLDNTFSLMTKKEVIYKVEVKLPNNNEE